MMKLKCFLSTTSLILILAGCAFAQSETDLNEGLTINYDAAGSPSPYTLRWWGRSGFYYFIEESDDLKNWTYFPYATVGSDDIGSVSFDIDANRKFFRLYLTNELDSPILTNDFDGDFVPNKAELDQGTDVYSLSFSDSDLIADDWEYYFFGNLNQNDGGNDDSDFTDNLEESQLGLDPNADERGFAFTYTYDAVGRLIGASSNMLTVSYTLDEEGNILNKN